VLRTSSTGKPCTMQQQQRYISVYITLLFFI